VSEDSDIAAEIDDLCLDNSGRPLPDGCQLEFVDIDTLRAAADEIRSLRAQLVEMEDRWLESETEAAGYRAEIGHP